MTKIPLPTKASADKAMPHKITEAKKPAAGTEQTVAKKPVKKTPATKKPTKPTPKTQAPAGDGTEKNESAARFFGEFLVGRGVVTRKVLEDAVKLQQSIDRPLIAMAIEKGFLTKEQLIELEGEKQEADGASVGVEIKDDGTMAFQQTKTKGHGTSDKGLYLAEALLQKGDIGMVQLHDLFKDYKGQFLNIDKQFWINQHIRESILPSIPHKEIVSFFVQVTIDTFIQYSKQSVRMKGVNEGMDMRNKVEYCFSQKVSGSRDLHFVLGFPEPLALAIASHMLRATCDEMDELQIDACKEFVNIVVGNALSKLSMKNYKLQAAPPKATTKTQMRDNLPRKCITLLVGTVVGDFFIMFFFEEGESVRRKLLFGQKKKPAEKPAPLSLKNRLKRK